MKNELQVFESQEFGKLTVIEVDGQPWFIGREVASMLGYKNTPDAIKQHCKYNQLFVNTNDSLLVKTPPNGIQIINEKDVYRLIMRSKLPSAERFQDWVCDEVLPSIRKTGSYSEKELSPAEFLLHQAQRMVDQERKMKQIETEQKKQSLELEEIKAKVTTTNSDFYTVSGFAAIRNLRHLDVNKANLLGRLASKLSRHYGIDIGKVKDERYGSVNTYHIDILTEAFRSFQREQKGRLLP